MRLGFPDAGNDPPDTMTRQAYDLNTEGFGPGSNGPLVIAADLPDRGGAVAVDSFADRAARRTRRSRSCPDPRINEAGDAAMITVIPTGSPQDKETEDLVTRLRDDVVPKQLGTRDQRRDRRRDRRARGPERVHEGPHAAVHRRRGRALVPAAAGGVPLAADLAQGGDHEPALGGRRLRRDDAGREGRGASGS